MTPRLRSSLAVCSFPLLLLACDGGEDEVDAATASDAAVDAGETDAGGGGGAVDITDAVFSDRSPDCAAYVGEYRSDVLDVGRSAMRMGLVSITLEGDDCRLVSNGIPNHDFDDGGAFATPAAEVAIDVTLTGAPVAAAETTALSLQIDNGVFLDGVKLDVLAAACYGVGPDPVGSERIGCMTEGTPWRYDPMFAGNMFGTDTNNAHTQPTGAYHYHGDPRAMYDDTGTRESGVIGFAADGFPIFGPWIDDGGTIRRVVSGYTLRSGARVSQPGEAEFPGGDYDGTFVDDYEFTDAGDLDECNGMTRDGAYGYYVTDAYPWVIGCFRGTPHASFRKTVP